MNVIKRTVVFLATVYVLLVVTVYVMQRSLIYAPSGGRVAPNDSELPGVREVVLTTTEGHRLYSWYGNAQPSRPTILYLHGNGAGVSNRASTIKVLMAHGYGVFMLGYPGYSGSDGSPSEAALVAAAGLAYRFLIDSGIDARNLVIYGESLGTAVAVQLAAAQPAGALVLQAPMSSILDIARGQYPFLPVSWLLKDTFLSTDFIGRVEEPLLIVHGSADTLIPIDSGKRLFAAAGEPKFFHVVDGAGHNNLYQFDTEHAVAAFIDRQVHVVD